eukprot:TRINITY_DN398_c0_g1_i3.p1 TRINITY_DN398_c0_g1~~TRINITY_DN398_c0_g1_i3.p1  ORF type:complete len:660 (-),score=225.43 TRINITY_DN398_c0_g1_i3:155-2134(-)
MKTFAKCMTLILVANVSADKVTPVQKVIELLKNMKSKGEAEMNDEQVQFAKYKQFCDMTLGEKKRVIDEAADKMDMLSADVEKSSADADQLSYELQGHKVDLNTASIEKDKASKVRETERADYQVTLKDYTESIDALSRAMRQVKAKNFDRKQVSSLLQLRSFDRLKHLISAAKSKLDSLLKQPEADGYEFQSGGVLDMLEELETKFSKERMDLEKSEASKKHTYALLVQSIDARLNQLQKDVSEKTQFKARKLQKKASASADLQEIQGSKAVDEKYYKDLSATCSKKAYDYTDRQHLRKDELDAIQKATDIISSGVSGAPSLLQTKKAALAFLRTKGKEIVNPEKIARFLQDQATQLNSRMLSGLAERIEEQQPSDDAMEKVRQMIEGLITKLHDQANEEATKKGYCDKELKTNEQTRSEKSDLVESLNADLEECRSTIAQLGDAIAQTSKEITQLNEAMNEATRLRQKEKAKNAATVKEAKESQAAVANAISVLNEFYAKASEASSFVQIESKTFAGQPDIFNSPYTGMSSAKGGVVGMLEVIESDFARLQAEAQAAEQAASKEHDSFMEDSKVDKAKKTKDIEHMTMKKSERTQEESSLDNDLHGTQKELDAAEEYYNKLKPDCVDAGVAFENRKAQREQEIKDLHEALEMLEAVR